MIRIQKWSNCKFNHNPSNHVYVLHQAVHGLPNLDQIDRTNKRISTAEKIKPALNSREGKQVWESQLSNYKEELVTLRHTLTQLQKQYQVKEDIRSLFSDVLFKCKEQLQSKDHSQLKSNYTRIKELIQVLKLNNMPTSSWESLASIFKELRRLHDVDETSYQLTQKIESMKEQESTLESTVSRLQEEYTQAKRHVDQLSSTLSQTKLQSSHAKTRRRASEQALQSYLDRSQQDQVREWSRFQKELSKIKN